jgi:hypothetical protein
MTVTYHQGNIETFRIPVWNVEKLKVALGKLNKRAEKLGLEPLTFRHVGIDWDQVVSALLGEMQSAELHLFEVEMRLLKVEGWRFIGALELIKDGKGREEVLVNSLGGFEIPEDMRHFENARVCDHCQCNRLRKATFVIEHEEGEIKKVGSTCLEDFLGVNDPNKLIKQAQLLGQIHDQIKNSEDPDAYGPPPQKSEVETSGTFGYTVDIEIFLATVKKIQDAFGFRKSKLSNPTWRRAWEACRELENGGRLPFDQDHAAAAQKALAYVDVLAGRPERLVSDYQHNLIVACRPYVTFQLAPIAASIFRAMEIEEDMIKNKNAGSKHIGTLKKRVELPQTKITKVHEFYNRRGSGFVHEGTTQDGNTVVWFAKEGMTDVGATVTVRGVVNTHTSFRGIKQTILNRVELE